MINWDGLERELRAACPGLELRRGEAMSRHTSFRVGGPAALMAFPDSLWEAKTAVRTAQAAGIRPFFLGNGTNLLVSDAGYDGFIVKTFAGSGVSEFEEACAEGSAIAAGSGLLLSKLANFALTNGLTGLEFAHGIPGTLGGAVTMNAGAYGGEMAQVLTSVTVLNGVGEEETLPAAECDLSYRHSAFSDGTRLILSAKLALEPGDPAAIKARMEELGEKRKSKQPLDLPSAGSTFKRPAGHFAAGLIEQCGLKGFAVGGAQVSEKHAGFVVNRGGAACADILELVAQVKKKVLAETGVELELEVRTLGV